MITGFAGAGPRIVVAGAGAIGSTCALVLARAGARVTLADPAAFAQNASGVAAGMLAPAFEALLDTAADRYGALRAARDLWPALAAALNIAVYRRGVLGVAAGDRLNQWEAELRHMGAPVTRHSAAGVAARWPWLRAPDGAVWSDEDWRILPRAALAALHRAGIEAGVEIIKSGVQDFAANGVRLADGQKIATDHLVIATGADLTLAGLAPELQAVQPIKGHILRALDHAWEGPVVRFQTGYICPDPAGAVIGATMEIGQDNTEVDAAKVRDLQNAAATLVPGLSSAQVTAAVGVRGSTANGLPLVGPAGAPGVWLAVGARRNGWLLAPQIAQDILQMLVSFR